jgi:pyruvate-formate lyase-activating enzyme
MNNDRVMSEELLSDALTQIKNLGLPAGDGAKTICFSGGEPFLFYELLKSGVAKAKEMGFSTEAHTNGFWGAETGERISEMLGNLALD